MALSLFVQACLSIMLTTTTITLFSNFSLVVAWDELLKWPRTRPLSVDDTRFTVSSTVGVWPKNSAVFRCKFHCLSSVTGLLESEILL